MGGPGTGITLIVPYPFLVRPEQDAWGAQNQPGIEVVVPWPTSTYNGIQVDAEIWDTSDPTISRIELVFLDSPGGKFTPAALSFGDMWEGTFEKRGNFDSAGGLFKGTPEVGHLIITAKRKAPLFPGTPVRLLVFDPTVKPGPFGPKPYGLWFGVGQLESWYWPRPQENVHLVAATMPPPLDKVAKVFQAEVVGIPGKPRYKIRPQTSGMDFTKPASSAAAATVMEQPMVASFRTPPPKMVSGYVF